MIEVTGNLWAYPADVRVITTNGTVKRNGECVMGRGCALEAKQRWPEVPRLLGLHIKNPALGNHVHFLITLSGDGTKVESLYSFPVKHNWNERADIALIRRSAQELVHQMNDLRDRGHKRDVIVMPRPGCGNGGLRWEDVKPILAPILDDRFHVITWGGSPRKYGSRPLSVGYI